MGQAKNKSKFIHPSHEMSSVILGIKDVEIRTFCANCCEESRKDLKTGQVFLGTLTDPCTFKKDE